MSRELRLLKDFFTDLPSWPERDIMDLPGKPGRAFSGDMQKILNGKCDFHDLKENYLIELEVPGVKKKEIDIELNNHLLTVSWERTREHKKGLGRNSRFERNQGRFTRSFNVQGADESAIDAKLDNGVLRITVPKKDEYRPRHISVS